MKADQLDALILPGGFGAAKNLCSYAFDGATDEGRSRTSSGWSGRCARPRSRIGFICIAPVIAARLFGADHVKVTIGNDPDTAAHINGPGAREHVDCAVDQIVVDQKLELVSTPAYMLGPWIAPVAAGIDKLVGAVAGNGLKFPDRPRDADQLPVRVGRDLVSRVRHSVLFSWPSGEFRLPSRVHSNGRAGPPQVPRSQEK